MAFTAARSESATEWMEGERDAFVADLKNSRESIIHANLPVTFVSPVTSK
jgi:hypothetical protein